MEKERITNAAEIERESLHFRTIELVNKAFSRAFKGEEYQRLELVSSADKERSWEGVVLMYFVIRNKHSKENFLGSGIDFATPEFSDMIKELAPDYGFAVYRTGTALLDKMTRDRTVLVEIRLTESQSTYSGSLLKIDIRSCKRE